MRLISLLKSLFADKRKGWATSDGKAPRPGFENASAPAPIDPRTGEHQAYWILSDSERAKGFVRPVRMAYRHSRCGTVTSMDRPIAETFARDPKYYGRTMCAECGEHFPVGKRGEFTWMDGDTDTGIRVGT
jgi:hypothetical protein